MHCENMEWITGVNKWAGTNVFDAVRVQNLNFYHLELQQRFLYIPDTENLRDYS